MPRPRLLRAATTVLLVQGVALLGAAIFLAVRSTGSDVNDRAGAFSGAGVTLVGAAAFAGLGWLLRPPTRRAAGTPALMLEVLSLIVSTGLFQAGQYGYGVPVALLGLIGVVGLIGGGAVGKGPAGIWDEPEDAPGDGPE